MDLEIKMESDNALYEEEEDNVDEAAPTWLMPDASKIKRKRSITRIYTDEECFAIIRAVKKRECVWNIESPNYKIRNAHAIAWNQIAEEVRIPKEDVSVKWNLLRQQFRVNIKI